MNTKLPLGKTLITPAAQRALHPQDVFLSLCRHSQGDWGDCSTEDWKANQDALLNELRILSVYPDRTGCKFWIISEASREATTIHLPEDD